MIKVFSLHARFSGFFSACFREAVEAHGARIEMVCSRPAISSPYEDSVYRDAGVSRLDFRGDLTGEQIKRRILEFSPDILLVSGWKHKEYLPICRWYRRQGGFVVAFCDTQFEGTFRQRVGCALSRAILHRAIDVLWVAGERQRDYAKRLGYSTASIWEPMLCCDWRNFAAARRPYAHRKDEFLFVGRFVPEKGFDILLDAYEDYRQSVKDPWGLRVIGAGPLVGFAQERQGVLLDGFVQPKHLPEQMSTAKCFVLPSRYEPWGVVIQEAASLGLPIIASDAAGAAVHLVRDNWNGLLTPAGSREGLCAAMKRMHCLDDARIRYMGMCSFQLSKQFTPKVWAQRLVDGVGDRAASSGR